MIDMSQFVALILTHNRADNVKTYKTLRRSGYTGAIRLVVDDLDPAQKLYEKNFPGEVVLFSKEQIAHSFDRGDNFNDLRGIFYARNACFDIAADLNFKWFIELDDDYTFFSWRFNSKNQYLPSGPRVLSLDVVFYHLIEFFENTSIKTIALSQGGDWIGGADSTTSNKMFLHRKAMNSFICSTERRFQFIGRVNEDVNTYVKKGSTGDLFFSTNQLSLTQVTTQKSKGGMTSIYQQSGTYVKSFYSVLYHPSSVTISSMGDKHPRLHHRIDWTATTPKIISEQYRKVA